MTLADVRAQQGLIDRDAVLGRFMWYSVPEDTMLDYDTVVAELGALGLTKLLPKPPREYDIFRRVTRESERRKVPSLDAKGDFIQGQWENWLIRDVASKDEDTIVRRVVVEKLDANGKRLVDDLGYKQIMELRYKRPTGAQTKGRLEFEWINGHDAQKWPTAQAIADRVKAEYERWQDKLAHASVRHWIQQTILAMGATPARVSGGIYFLEEQYATQVEALEEFVAKYLPQKGEMHSVEVPDNKKQRDLIAKAIERETVGAIDDMIVEIGEIKREGKLTSKKYLEIQKRITAMKRKQKKYMRLLEKDGSSIESRLDLLDIQANDLTPLQAPITRNRTKKEKVDEPEPVEEESEWSQAEQMAALDAQMDPELAAKLVEDGDDTPKGVVGAFLERYQ